MRVIKWFNVVSLLSDHAANASFCFLFFVSLKQSVSNWLMAEFKTNRGNLNFLSLHGCLSFIMYIRLHRI